MDPSVFDAAGPWSNLWIISSAMFALVWAVAIAAALTAAAAIPISDRQVDHPTNTRSAHNEVQSRTDTGSSSRHRRDCRNSGIPCLLGRRSERLQHQHIAWDYGARESSLNDGTRQRLIQESLPGRGAP